MSRFQFYIKGLLCLGLVLFGLSACNRAGPTAPTPTAQIPAAATTGAPVDEPAAATHTPTLPPPPAALRVNGYEVSLAEYQAEIAQFKAASGADPTPDQVQQVIQNLTEQALLAQAGLEAGYQTDDGQISQRIGELAAKLGGEAALQTWMQANGYDADSFRQALARQQAAAWMRDQVLAGAPLAAVQVHARQILLYNSEEAADILGQLKAGNDFGNLAVTYDPVTRGELGWFPRGYLTDPKLDEIVFNLSVGQFSDVIETAAGFHIMQVLERSEARPLSPEALLLVQAQALKDWLEARHGQAQIEILLP